MIETYSVRLVGGEDGERATFEFDGLTQRPSARANNIRSLRDAIRARRVRRHEYRVDHALSKMQAPNTIKEAAAPYETPSTMRMSRSAPSPSSLSAA